MAAPTPQTTKKRQRILLISLVVGLVAMLIGLVLWLKPNNPPTNSVTPTAGTAPSKTTNTLPNAQPTNAAPTGNPLAPLPKSLRNTEVDGEIIINEQKQLVVTFGLRRLFDYFLSTQGEEDLPTIHRRVTDYINSHTPQPAAGQAIAIYHKYIEYLSEISKIEASLAKYVNKDKPTLDLTLIKQRQQAIDALRSRLFDAATIKAFFGQEDALNEYTLAGMEAQQNPNLTPEQREAIQAQAKAKYLQSIGDKQTQERLQQQANIETLLAETEKLKAQGATEDQLNAMRRKYVDEAAVQRLSKLDAEEQSFEQRIAQFKQQRDQLIASQGNSPATNQAISDLEKRLFNEQERLRLSVYLDKR